MPTFVREIMIYMTNMIIFIDMILMMIMIVIMNMMLRLDQQKEKALVAAYSKAGNPVSRSFYQFDIVIIRITVKEAQVQYVMLPFQILILLTNGPFWATCPLSTCHGQK